MSCTVVVTRGTDPSRREACGHPASDHVTMLEAFTMIEHNTYCRACFAELVVIDQSDVEHAYSNTPVAVPIPRASE